MPCDRPRAFPQELGSDPLSVVAPGRVRMPPMARPRKAPAPPQLDAGWAALREGQWETARERFAECVEAGVGAEAFEGSSWAAWWLDDAEAVLEARERAHRLYEKAGDRAGAARMATWLACDQLDFRGAIAVASGWLGRAHRLIDPLEPGPEHGWLAFMEGYMAHAHGDTAMAMERGRRAADLGREYAVPDLNMLGLALEGAALVACARVAEGMRYLDEATATALQGEATIPISGAWACCFLVSACSAVRDYRRAFEWCDRIAEFANRFGSRYMLAFCRAEYGAVHMWRGRWEDAEAVLEASVEDFARARPVMVGMPLAALAELRRRQGRWEEATALLERAGTSVSAQLCWARLALDRGDATQAAELAERVLRQIPTERGLDRMPALELLARACAASGEREQANSALAALREIERAVETEPLHAAADLTEGVLAAACGEHERARPLLEDATDGFERSGGRFEAAVSRIELAATLAELGRSGAAEREATTALAALRTLGTTQEVERARRLLAGVRRPADADNRLPELTPREREVLGLVAEGLTNRQIAERLVVSEHTVHRHVTNLLRKLDLPSRTAAAALAARRGLLENRRV